MPKVILDLCGGSGAWSKPYKDAGYDVRLINLPEYDVTNVANVNDSLLFLHPYGGFMDVKYKDIYGILAAPPCTEFSLAKNGNHRKRDLQTGMETVEACMQIIWAVQIHTKLSFWALENPVGLLRRFLGKPQYSFYQWWFGDKGIKRTDLWGCFNIPKQTVFKRPDDPYYIKQYKSGKKNQFAWSAPQKPEWYDGPKLDRAALRAITPAGFAQAFFMANQLEKRRKIKLSRYYGKAEQICLTTN